MSTVCNHLQLHSTVKRTRICRRFAKGSKADYSTCQEESLKEQIHVRVSTCVPVSVVQKRRSVKDDQ